MADIIICVLTNLFRIYLISRFMQIFLNNEKNKNHYNMIRQLLVYGGFFLVNTVTYLVFHTVWINIVCNIVGIGLIVLTYSRSIKTVLFVTCSVYMINIGCDTISTLLFVNYEDGLGFNQTYEVITVFLIFICEMLTEKIVDTKRKVENVRNISLVLVPLCSIGMLCAIIYTKSSKQAGLVIVSIGLVLINFFTFYLYDVLSNIFISQYENEVLRQKVQGYANQLNVILQGEEKVKALRHDMKHHMNELKILAVSAESREIEEYIDNMKEFIINPAEIVSSGNLEIDSVMNYMLHKAKQELRTVNVDVRLPKSVRHFFDLNVILGNLLENSIEAARQTEEKRLDVAMELKQGFLRIQIENSYNGRLKQKSQKLLTTKNEKGLHGIGLENVRKIVKKYDGTMEICPDINTFRIMLILYVSKVED